MPYACAPASAVGLDVAVPHAQPPARPASERGVVSDDDERASLLLVQGLDQLDHLVSGRAIEITGRLVTEHERGPPHDGAGNGDTLALPTGKLPRPVRGPVGKPHPRERLGNTPRPLGRRDPGKDHGQRDVVTGTQAGDEIEELENNPMDSRRIAASASSSRVVTSTPENS